MLQGAKTMITGGQIGDYTPVLKQKTMHGQAVFAIGMQPFQPFPQEILLLGTFRPVSKTGVAHRLKHQYQPLVPMNQATAHKAFLQNSSTMKESLSTLDQCLH